MLSARHIREKFLFLRNRLTILISDKKFLKLSFKRKIVVKDIVYMYLGIVLEMWYFTFLVRENSSLYDFASATKMINLSYVVKCLLSIFD